MRYLVAALLLRHGFLVYRGKYVVELWYPPTRNFSYGPIYLIMIIAYHLAQMFFVLAGLQYYFCSRDPIYMPLPEGRGIFYIWGALATIGMIALFIAGFFIVSWWMPITAWLSGQVAFSLVPQRWKESKGPGVGFLSTVAGMGCSVALFFL